MTEREKIIKVIDEWASKAVTANNFDGASVYNPYNAVELADALIAAGIGDVKTAQEIGASATAMAVFEAAQAEHRAEVAERALKKLASFFAHNAKFLKDEREKERYQKTIFDDWINQAEEELAEEGK